MKEGLHIERDEPERRNKKLKYMEPLTFLALFGTCTCCAFIAGYLIGNIKATCESEQTRRWWMNRQIKRERR
jgi:hypothetical protein